MKCTACRQKCFPITCPHCKKSICIPCRAPNKHDCISSDKLTKIYEEKLKTKFNSTGQRNPGSKHWDN